MIDFQFVLYCNETDAKLCINYRAPKITTSQYPSRDRFHQLNYLLQTRKANESEVNHKDCVDDPWLFQGGQFKNLVSQHWAMTRTWEFCS